MPNQIVYDNSGGPGSSSVGRGNAFQYASTAAAGPPAQQDTQATANGQYQMANSLFNAYNLANAPANQLIQNKLGDLQSQADLLGANYTTQSGYINQSAQNQLAGLGLQSQGQDLQSQTLQRQAGLLPQLQGIQQQQYGIAGQQLGLQGQGLDIQGKQLGIQGQGIAQQLADLYYGNQRANQNLVSSKAAQGGGNTAGMALGQQDLAQQLQSGVSNLDRSQQQLGLQGEQLGLSRNQLGLQQQGLGLQQQQSNLNYNEQLAANKDAQKQLDLMKQKTGLDQNEINNRTQQALDQLGLSTSLSTLDVYKAMADAQQGLYNPVQQVFGTLYQLSGLNPFMSLG